MKNLYITFVVMLFVTSCSIDLDQTPSNLQDTGSLTDYGPVLNAAYGYHFDALGPMAVFGDFRADNALFDETPFTDFDEFGSNALTSSMSNDFFKPFYAALYNSILSANGVIENSTSATEVGEAQFLRALSYFKLVQVFGDVTVNLLSDPTVEEIAAADLTRQPKSQVYNDIIIPDLENAMSALSSASAAAAGGRATSNAAQALLGKVYAQMGNYTAAESELEAVVNGAAAAGISLEDQYANVFGADNDLNSEIIFATQVSSTAAITNSNLETFVNWYVGANTKADPVDGAPVDADLIAAYDAGDLRATFDGPTSIKYDEETGNDQDWIEIRLADVILLLAEAMNENGADADDVLALLDPIRTRAGLGSLVGTAATQAEVRKAVLDERRFELAFEGQRWFDLVRIDAASPGMLNAEMGETISSDYHVFPIPNTEVTSFDDIVQNPGY